MANNTTSSILILMDLDEESVIDPIMDVDNCTRLYGNRTIAEDLNITCLDHAPTLTKQVSYLYMSITFITQTADKPLKSPDKSNKLRYLSEET